jgi:hypothetical protein
MSIVLAYLEIIAMVIILVKGYFNSVEQTSTNICIIIGLIAYLATNITFGLGYYRIVNKKMKIVNRINEDAAQQN